MSDDDLKFPDWQRPLQDLILELDRNKMLQKMEEVEALILERLRQIPAESDGRAEHDALHDALAIVRVLKRDKLGFPDWK